MLIGYHRSQRMSYTLRIPGLEGAHVTKCISPEGSWKYCQKEDTRLAGPWKWGTALDLKVNHWAIAKSQPSKLDALEYIKTNLPRDMLLNGDRIEKNLKYYYTSKVTPVTYSMDKFIDPPMDLSKSVILCGSSGMGKTTYALAHFKKPLLVRHIDMLLKEFDPLVHDGLVFDDIGFSHWPIPSIIGIMDMEHDSNVHCRYGVGIIPAKFPRIFTINEISDIIPVNISQSQYDAIHRRVVIRSINEKMFV